MDIIPLQTDPEKDLNRKIKIVKAAIIISVIFFIADYIYKIVEDISYTNREKCIINKFLPKAGFVFFENFVEISLLVFLGVFIAVLLEKYFLRFKKYYPKNTISAFVYASILPVCACTAIPVVKTMQEKMDMKAIVTFILAAPLLNPYIIMISFSVLGAEYVILRIIASFVLSISSGYVVNFFYSKEALNLEKLKVCDAASCGITNNNIYLQTWDIFKSIIPYLVAGGVLTVGLELLMPKSSVLSSIVNNSLLSEMLFLALGIPFYLCNGTDVFLLKPLLCAGMPMGTAVAFSLTSTAVCVTSFFMLFKFMGRRLTFILIIHIFIVALIIRQLIIIFL